MTIPEPSEARLNEPSEGAAAPMEPVTVYDVVFTEFVAREPGGRWMMTVWGRLGIEGPGSLRQRASTLLGNQNDRLELAETREVLRAQIVKWFNDQGDRAQRDDTKLRAEAAAFHAAQAKPKRGRPKKVKE